MRVLLALLLMVLFAVAAQAQSTVTANIHNACGWEPGASYSYHAGPPNGHFIRVNNGAGWSPTGSGTGCITAPNTVSGGSYTAGSALNNYQLIAPTTGSCTSGSTPGPTGTGSSITDGGCTWKYVGPVDYVTFSAWAFDSGVTWTSGTVYGYQDVVHTTDPNLPVFQLYSAGCTSTVKPTTSNVGTGTPFSDGCYWVGSLSESFVIDSSQHYLYYTSGPNFSPMSSMHRDTFTGTIAPATNNIQGYIQGNLFFVTTGTAMQYTSIAGTGIVANQSLHQEFCCGNEYYIAINQSDTPGAPTPEAVTQSYGALTATSLPTTYPLAANEVINYTGTSNPQVGWGCQQHGGVLLNSGSGSSWAISAPDTFSGTIYVADECGANQVPGGMGTFGTTTQFSVADVWNDQEYVGGSNGEANPIEMWNNNYRYNDSESYLGSSTTVPPYSAGWDEYGYKILVQPAPGEGFASTYQANPGLALAGYNANYGVGFRGVSGNEGLGISDSSTQVSGLQLTSNTGLALDYPNRAGNVSLVDHSILQGGTGALLVANSGAATAWVQNLFVTNGNIGLAMDYGGYILNNTFVCPAGGCESGIDNTANVYSPQGTIISNNLEFGFTHFVSSNFYNNQYPWGTCGECFTMQGTNDATDVASTDGVNWDTTCSTGAPSYNFIIPCTGYTFSQPFGSLGVYSFAVPFQTGYEYYSTQITGTPGVPNTYVCGYLTFQMNTPPLDPSTGIQPTTAGTCSATFAISPSSVFAGWPSSDYNILNTSVAYGGGTSLSSVQFFCTCAAGTINPNTPDLFGNARPTAGRYDIGAVQFDGSPPVMTGFGGRTFR